MLGVVAERVRRSRSSAYREDWEWTDALVGFQQELITSQAGGRLVVDGLVVKDYPILLHLVGLGS